MAVYTTLDRKTLASLAEDHNLGRLTKATGVPAGSVNTHYLLETRKGKFFLKVDEVKSRQESQWEVLLLLFLRGQGFVCPEPLADRHGRYLHDFQGKAVSLYPLLPGRSFSEAALTPLHVEQAGQVLASLHCIGQGYRKAIDNRFSFDRAIEIYQTIRAELPSYFRHLIHILDDEVAHHQQYQEDRLPKGIIHGDLFADNLLFRGGKITGVLDFEAACSGKFIYDVATAVNALCYVDGHYLIERFEALLRGYQSARMLSLAEWDAFPNELRFSALRFTITRLKDFFLRPMDDRARVNKDFRDFLERLLVLRRERPGGMDKLLMAMAIGYDYRQGQKVRIQEKTRGDQALVKRKETSKQWVTSPGLTAAHA
jgi:homoserine kinase type II